MRQIEKVEARKIKNESKFLKKAAVFISGCDEIIKCLREKINKDGDSIASIRFDNIWKLFDMKLKLFLLITDTFQDNIRNVEVSRWNHHIFTSCNRCSKKNM